jgi:hypothetical protein
MKLSQHRGRHLRPAITLLIAASCLTLAGFGNVEKQKPGGDPAPLTVPKATCGPGDHPETAL